MGNTMWIGSPYYFLLSLSIICYASYTMVNLIDQAKQAKLARRRSIYSALLGAAFVFSLGLWTKHAVTLLASDFMLVVNWRMVLVFGCTMAIVCGAIVLHVRQPFAPRLTDGLAAGMLACASALLQYMSFLTHSVAGFTLHPVPFVCSYLVVLFAAYATLSLMRSRPRHFAIICSLILGAGGMIMHRLGLSALTIQYSNVLTTDRLNDYLMLLAVILWMATFLITSFSLATWSSKRKYAAVDQRYKLLVENSMDTIALICDGKWEYMNPSGLRLFQAACAKELIGSSVFDLLQERDHGVMRDWLNHFHTGGELPRGPVELQWKTLNGDPVLTEAVPTRTDLNGTPVMQTIIRDISERKRNERMFVNAEKLAIAGQLAAGIAHEIRNPLTSLKGFIQLMSTGRVPHSRYFAIMKSELHLIESIISELLMLSKPQLSEMAQIDISQLLDEAVRNLDNQAKLRQVKIVLAAERQPLFVLGVAGQLKQVFLNVLRNAIESMQNGGTVKVELAQNQGETIVVRIQDQGSGIPREQLSKIGQPFYTTKDEGTGLGLMVTYKIIDNHRGQIQAESELGVGTTFTITLPRHNPS